MADRIAPSAEDDVAASLAGLQDQVDALTVTLEAHQRLFEQLHAAGVLRGEHDVDQPR